MILSKKYDLENLLDVNFPFKISDINKDDGLFYFNKNKIKTDSINFHSILMSCNLELFSLLRCFLFLFQISIVIQSFELYVKIYH